MIDGASLYIVYDIPEMGIKDQKAGPYAPEEIDFHFADISSCEGVTNARRLSALEILAAQA